MNVMRPALANRLERWLRDQIAGASMQALIRRASAVLLLQVAGAGAMFLTGMLLGRSLGAEAYGRLSLAVTIIIVLRLGASLGLPMMVMRTVAIYQGAKDWPRLNGLLRYAALTTLGSGALTALIAAAALMVFSPHAFSPTGTLILMALPLLLVLPITETAAGVIRGFHHVAAGQATELARSAFYIVLLAGAALAMGGHLSAPGALGLRFAAEALGMILTLVLLARLLPRDLRGTPRQGSAKEWRKGQLSFLAIEAMYLIYQQTDILVLGAMRPMNEVGVYRMASNLGFILVFASLVAGAALGPLAANAWAAGRKTELKDVSIRLSRISFALTLLLYVALIAAAPIFIAILGRDFAGMTAPLVILGASHVVRSLMSASPTIVLMTGSERAAAWGIAATALINLILNAAFIPHFGIVGSAVATAISTILLSLYYAALAHRRTGISGSVFEIKSGAALPKVA